uniref:uncharacterized protein LOC105758211 n=1 Tax=Odobenus rosmarus divergens TaxID=9708 RepID=UPI00063C7C88|nr:PREDICTED: uncharacterized protein LOC105758211 [Odobenus rosmarus divergens]
MDVNSLCISGSRRLYALMLSYTHISGNCLTLPAAKGSTDPDCFLKAKNCPHSSDWDKTSGLVETIFEKNSLLEEWKLSEVIEHYNDRMGIESQSWRPFEFQVFSSVAECLSSLEQA